MFSRAKPREKEKATTVEAPANRFFIVTLAFVCDAKPLTLLGSVGHLM